MENDNPIAQGTESAEPTASAEAVQGAPENGVQKRINELIAKQKSFEEQAAVQLAARDSQIAELIGALSRQPVAAAPPVADPYEGLEPEEREKFSRVLTPVERRLEATVARLEAQMVQQRFQQNSANEDPRVLKRAAELKLQWQRDPSRGGWTDTDAVVYARGELGVTEAQAARVRDERGRFNNGGSAPLTNHSAPPLLETPGLKPYPHDFDQWDANKQVAFIEERLKGKTF